MLYKVGFIHKAIFLSPNMDNNVANAYHNHNNNSIKKWKKNQMDFMFKFICNNTLFCISIQFNPKEKNKKEEFTTYEKKALKNKSK